MTSTDKQPKTPPLVEVVTGSTQASQALRLQVEETLRQKESMEPKNQVPISAEETERVLHELRVHQIQLEMQNEELCKAQLELEATLARYFDLYDIAPVGYCTISENGSIVEANIKADNMLGLARGALVGERVTRFIYTEDQDTYYRLHKQLFGSSEPESCELRMVQSDGTVFSAHLSAALAQNKSGKPVSLMMLSDITERKLAEKTIAESEEKYRIIFNNEVYAICIFDLETYKFLDINHAFCSLYGYSREELMSGMTIDDITIEQQASETSTQQSLSEGTIFIPRRYHRKKDGTIIPVEIVGGPYSWKDKKVMFGLIHDITARIQAEELLRTSEERFRKLFEKNVSTILIIDPETGSIVDANQAAADFYGWSIETLRQMRVQEIDITSPEQVNAAMEKTRVSMPLRLEFRHRRADGSIRDVEVASSCVNLKRKDFLYSIIHDITERKLIESALIEEEEKYRKIFENQLVAICIFDSETSQFIDINETYIQLYGYSRKELMGGMTIYDLSIDQESTATSFNEAMSRGSVFIPLRYHRKKDGTIFPVEIIGEPIMFKGRPALFGMIKDITDRIDAEEKLEDSKVLNFAILNSLSAQIAVIDQNGEITAVNQSWQRFALENSLDPGFPTPHTRIGTNYLRICREVTGEERDDALKAINGIKSVLDGRLLSFCMEYPCHSPEQDRWFSMNVNPFGSKQGGVVVVHTEITEQKKVNLLLKNSEERLRTAAKVASFGIYSYDFGLGQAYYSDEFMRLFGLPSGAPLELDADLAPQSLHPADKAGFLACMKAANDPTGSGKLEHEYRIIHSDGRERWLQVIGQTTFSGNRPNLSNGIIHDCTDRKQAEVALMKTQAELERRVLERTADLEKTNATLIMMLDYARKVETDIEERVVANLRINSLQLLDRLKKQQLSQGALDIVELLEKNTQDLAHPLVRNLESLLLKLTPREMQIANFIRQGKTSKDIMQILDLSFHTLESHRNNLRKKLGLRHTKINLIAYLNSKFEK